VSLRELNRATLARQLLLQRSPMSALDAIEHLVGVQAQAPLAPYYGLWSRLDGFTGEELSGLLTSRKTVRIVLMRGAPSTSPRPRTDIDCARWSSPHWLVDGFVAGSWELVGKGESTSLCVQPYVRLGDEVLDEVTAEANRLLEWAFGVTAPQVAITA
jgi:Winged helix DNA-binding domain